MHFVLPWLIAAAGFVVYLATRHSWMSLESVGLTAKVAGWDWNTMQMGPVTLLVTWPLRALPEAWIPMGLNSLSGLLAGCTLGLLAKCVALLPHDRTREQRQRERSDFSFLTLPLAWVPPVAAAGLLAFQLTFWENATAMTGEMVSLTLFALCVFFFLRFRVLQEDKYLAFLAFTFGAAAANDWGMVAFCPLFFLAIVWAKGASFFEARFLIRTTLAGLAGVIFYLVSPLALTLADQSDATFLEALRTLMATQRQFILSFPRWALLFCGAASVLPIFFIGIRWPSTFGDMSAAGAAITNFLFRLIHVAFLAFCTWAMFDPPFSPRARGLGLPFLHLYLLTALAIGYFLGYVLLVFGQEPERKLKRTSAGMAALSRLLASVAALGVLGATAGLCVYNLPAIRGQNGPLVRDLAANLVPPPSGNVALASDDTTLLMLAVGLTRMEGRKPEVLPIDTSVLKWQVYQRHHEKTYGSRWPALAIEKLSNPLADRTLLRQVYALSLSNQLYYAHPSFGYYFELFRAIPTNTIFLLARQPTNTYVMPPLPEDRFEAIQREWTAIRERYVDDPVLARMKKNRVTDARLVAAHYARAFNSWGVALQRRDRLEDAARFFDAAVALDKDNLAAVINARYNRNLRQGNREAVVLEKDLTDQLGRYRDLAAFLGACGPVDEPSFCFRLGRVFSAGNLNRQAARQFARSLELQPGSIETRLWLANSILNAELYDEVLQVIAGIHKDHPNLSPSEESDLAGLESWARFYKGDLPAAEKILEETHRKFPKRVEPLQTLNDIYVSANMTNAALETVDKIIALSPGDLKPLITRSAVLIHCGALDEALKTLNTVLQEKPDFVPALVNRSLAYSKLNRMDEAEKDYRHLLKIAPELTQVYYHLGEIDYQRGDALGARRNYRKFLETALPGSTEARNAQQRLDDIAAGKIGK